MFATHATDEKVRTGASHTMAFYIGRLDSRADPQGIASAMRTQTGSVDPKTAGTQMDACAARMARAVESIQGLDKATTPHK
jgi:hypothetical protein